jgi:hypothetical protein
MEGLDDRVGTGVTVAGGAAVGLGGTVGATVGSSVGAAAIVGWTDAGAAAA